MVLKLNEAKNYEAKFYSGDIILQLYNENWPDDIYQQHLWLKIGKFEVTLRLNWKIALLVYKKITGSSQFIGSKTST